ncbi:hypothetical protein DY78_GL002759 [Lactiplantibacillus fabifermentans DSM 21115]|uniref:Uncharacterized protein n=1 Tax=Lactiplantibacillus fabifermentans DSM 21115 TaxID=1413187 RepID=A0A0R2NQI1_9LACO|nr:hypothetical protein DY78_GL002759 [Lactiplantibacillus fabifermentans DSM 21115]
MGASIKLTVASNGIRRAGGVNGTGWVAFTPRMSLKTASFRLQSKVSDRPLAETGPHGEWNYWQPSATTTPFLK